ncbi:MAG: PQQ-dependent sugar dehydrogenase, partial [Chloroflexota bacterium]|nr:PQQ-dependent sugar dehydrogenase [Chloroflexota bacterium]
MSGRFVRIIVILALLTLAIPGTPARAQDPVALLSLALEEQLEVNAIVGDPALGEDVAAIREALVQAAPRGAAAGIQLQAALLATSGQTQQFVQAAAAELTSAVLLGELIFNGPDDMVPLRHQELLVHGGAGLAAINLALASLGAGPSAPGAGPLLQAADLDLTTGYRAEIVANGLSFASAVAVADDGTVYVAEAGFSYGLVQAPPRVLRVGLDGTTAVVAEGLVGPVAGLAVHDGRLFVSHRNTISSIDLATGSRTDIITGLPSLGDHYNENVAIGPDGKLYITQGSATESGVVGPDNYLFGWLPQAPQFSDVPCRDLTLAGVNYTTGNPLTPDAVDTATTGAYLSFGTPSTPGQVVRGQVRCSGAVLRTNLDGSGLEVFADGFRNNYGLAFHPDGRLFVTEQGPDGRGSRPVAGPDNLYEVVQGGWYGWPDFYGGVPVTDPSRVPPGRDAQAPVLLDPPPLARPPLAQFPNHATAVGFDFSRSDAFAPVGQAFVALFGD